MPAKQREPEFTKVEVVLAVALAAGCTVQEAADVLGISSRWAFEQRDRHSAIIDPLALLLKTLVKISKKEVKQIALAETQKELEKRLGRAMAAFDTALEDGDARTALDAAKEVFNRVLGKAAGTVNVNASGRVDHVLYVSNPAVLAALDSNVLADAELHQRARQLQSAGRTLAPVIDLASNAR